MRKLEFSKAIARLTGKKIEKPKDMRVIYLFSDKQGWEKDFNVNELGLIEIDNKRTVSATSPESMVYDIEIKDDPSKHYKLLITGHNTSFGINVLEKVAKGTPTPNELTHLWRKLFMVKFNELQDIKPPTSSFMSMLIGAGVGLVLVYLLQNFAGVKIF